MGRVVGIDLGTTNSLVAYVRDGEPRVIRDSSGDALVPSVVSLGDDGTLYVGREAQRRLLTASSRTVYSVKRFMGRGIDDVADEAALLPFRIGGDAGGVVRISLGDPPSPEAPAGQGREFTPPEIQRTNLAAVILQTMSLKLGAIEEYPFLDPPKPTAVREG